MGKEKTIAEGIENLKQYIKEDLIYQENKPESDFDEFCINHCEDIDLILDYVSELESNLYAANNIINEQKKILKNSVSKDKILEYKRYYENVAKDLSSQGIGLEVYEKSIGIAKFCNQLLKEERILW